MSEENVIDARDIIIRNMIEQISWLEAENARLKKSIGIFTGYYQQPVDKLINRAEKINAIGKREENKIEDFQAIKESGTHKSIAVDEYNRLKQCEQALEAIKKQKDITGLVIHNLVKLGAVDEHENCRLKKLDENVKKQINLHIPKLRENSEIYGISKVIELLESLYE